MKQVGIWMDKRNAYLIWRDKHNRQHTKLILSKIEEYNVRGGSGTRFKGGPQNVVQDSRYLEREKHQTKAYFKTIIDCIQKAEEIVLFGPAEIAPKFNKELQNIHRDLAQKVKGVITTDSMTKAQMKAWTRDFYASRNAT